MILNRARSANLTLFLLDKVQELSYLEGNSGQQGN